MAIPSGSGRRNTPRPGGGRGAFGQRGRVGGRGAPPGGPAGLRGGLGGRPGQQARLRGRGGGRVGLRASPASSCTRISAWVALIAPAASAASVAGNDPVNARAVSTRRPAVTADQRSAVRSSSATQRPSGPSSVASSAAASSAATSTVAVHAATQAAARSQATASSTRAPSSSPASTPGADSTPNAASVSGPGAAAANASHTPRRPRRLGPLRPVQQRRQTPIQPRPLPGTVVPAGRVDPLDGRGQRRAHRIEHRIDAPDRAPERGLPACPHPADTHRQFPDPENSNRISLWMRSAQEQMLSAADRLDTDADGDAPGTVTACTPL